MEVGTYLFVNGFEQIMYMSMYKLRREQLLCVHVVCIKLCRFVCPAQYDRWYVMFPGCPSVRSACPSINPSHFTGTTLCAALRKSYDFSTNYHACMAMPTWCRCEPPILFWHWPPFNLFPRSCLTWIFLIDLHWGVPLCVQRSGKAMTFQQIIMHVWQCTYDVDVNLLFCWLQHIVFTK